RSSASRSAWPSARSPRAVEGLPGPHATYELMVPIEAARDVVRRAIASRVFPAATADVGWSRGTLWRDAFGRLTFDAQAGAATEDTPFDLASLTKVVAATSVAMQLVHDRRVRLEEPVGSFFA